MHVHKTSKTKQIMFWQKHLKMVFANFLSQQTFFTLLKFYLRYTKVFRNAPRFTKADVNYILYTSPLHPQTELRSSQWKASVKVFTRQQACLVSSGFKLQTLKPEGSRYVDFIVEQGVCTMVLAQCFTVTVTQTEPPQSAGQRCYQNWPRNLTQARRTLCTLFTFSSFPFPLISSLLPPPPPPPPRHLY